MLSPSFSRKRRLTCRRGGHMNVLIVAAVLALGASAAKADEGLRREAAALFGQLKTHTAAASPQVELGRALFWDTRASADGKTACASCHPARDWGADRRAVSPHARGAPTSP